MKVGISLSGGGVRATVFHLGMLSRLANGPRWGDISFLSTVSGGSLCAALIFQKAGKRWPDAKQYQEVLPHIRTLLTTCNLQRAYMLKMLLNPWLLPRGRASIIARLLKSKWGIDADLQDLPLHPRMVINATCYETGKSWRFCAKRMGDYLANYVVNPSFPLADAAAASAAVPGLIGPLRLATTKYAWLKYAKGFGEETGGEPSVPVDPIAPKLTLWDGGVYDNLGSEAIFKPGRGLRKEVDFYIVSDASRPLGLEFKRFQWGLPQYIPPFRLIDVATDQVRSIRARAIVDHFNQKKNGAFFRMGNTADAIWSMARVQPPAGTDKPLLMSKEDVAAAAGTETTLRRLTPNEYDRLFRHGYEVADVTLAAYGCQGF